MLRETITLGEDFEGFRQDVPHKQPEERTVGGHLRKPNKGQDSNSAGREESSEMRNMKKGRMSKMCFPGMASEGKGEAKNAPRNLAQGANHMAGLSLRSIGAEGMQTSYGGERCQLLP